MARVYLTAKPEQDVPSFAEMGPDALDRALTRKTFAARLRKHSGQIKSLLRNQSFISGIGNSYSDEILWAAKLNPLRRASTLGEAERNALYAALRSVLREAVQAARKQYEAGKHPLHKQDRSFMKIHRKGQKGYACPRCGHRVSIIHGHGQETYFCRGCQQ
jgi:formamidopyrimidine-DNA glycosylase